MISKTATFIIVGSIVGSAAASTLYWRLAHRQAQPLANTVVVDDISGSTADGGSSILGLVEGSMAKPNMPRGSTVAVLATGDERSANEPVLVAKYEIPYSRRSLEGKAALQKRKQEILAQLAKQLILITTNWDNLIERQYENAGVGVHAISEDDHLPYFNAKQRVTLIKAHGTIEDINNIVIAAGDYEKYQDTHKYLYSVLRAMFVTQRVLFLGFSVADPNIRSLIHSIQNELTISRHYALLCDATNSDVEALKYLGVKTIHIDAKGDRTKATVAWLRGLVERSHIFGRGNKAKATMLNEGLKGAIKDGVPGTILRVRAALGPLSNPAAVNESNLLYGSLEQDKLEVEMGNLTRTFLSTNSQHECRFILHINPQHQRSKGYSWSQLRRRFEAIREFLVTFPSQIHIAHSPIPVDMNQFIMGRGKSFVCYKRGEAMGFEQLTMNANRWVVDADIKSFDNDFQGIQMLNKKLAENLGIDSSSPGWSKTLTLRIIELSLRATETTKYVIQCDESGVDSGKVLRDTAHAAGTLHKSVHLHLIDFSVIPRRVLVQRRARSTDLYGGMIDVSVSGHPETSDIVSEVLREVKEELRIDLGVEDVKPYGHRRRENASDVEWVEIFYADASKFTGTIDAVDIKFANDVDAVYWIDWPIRKNGRIDAKGVLRFGSLMVPTEGVIHTDEFVPGAIDEIDAVLGGLAV